MPSLIFPPTTLRRTAPLSPTILPALDCAQMEITTKSLHFLGHYKCKCNCLPYTATAGSSLGCTSTSIPYLGASCILSEHCVQLRCQSGLPEDLQVASSDVKLVHTHTTQHLLKYIRKRVSCLELIQTLPLPSWEVPLMNISGVCSSIQLASNNSKQALYYNLYKPWHDVTWHDMTWHDISYSIQFIQEMNTFTHACSQTWTKVHGSHYKYIQYVRRNSTSEVKHTTPLDCRLQRFAIQISVGSGK